MYNLILLLKLNVYFQMSITFFHLPMSLKVSGTDTFLDDVRERMKTKCISELRYNASLWVNTTETSESSLIDAVYDNDCPNDCSSSGTCTKGNHLFFKHYKKLRFGANE